MSHVKFAPGKMLPLSILRIAIGERPTSMHNMLLAVALVFAVRGVPRDSRELVIKGDTAPPHKYLREGELPVVLDCALRSRCSCCSLANDPLELLESQVGASAVVV